MCGIAGMMTRSGPPDAAVLDRLVEALGHRGPDGRGRRVADNVGLVHARLAIIDLEGGRQPLLAEDGTALVANGEIYNYRELRSQLDASRFRTNSDCEVPLRLYAREGLDFGQSLRGMYAIALHDPQRRRLVLARDPFGIKPLYYAETDAGFAFASEPQALIAAGVVAARLDEAARDELLQLQFAGRCAFAGVSRVQPGEMLVVEDGRIVERRQRPGWAVEPVRPMGEAEALAALDQRLMESIELHQRSDVAYGMFLSGGVDSSALLALMARTNPRPVLAFTACFPGSGARDETEHACRVAAAVGAEHVEIAVREADFWRWLPMIAAAVDDPAADYAVVPSWIMAREASRQVKVILSGEGGDEIFAGYGRYRAAARPWPFARRMRRRGALFGLGLLRQEPANWRDGLAAAERAIAGKGSALQRAQAVDVATWLPDDLLIKLDRCLMAHGVEGRVPFLDGELARFGLTLPDELKLRGGTGKWLLRRWLDRALPEAQSFSAKRGFTVPVGEWILGRPALASLLAGDQAVAEICRPGAVEALFTGDRRRAGFALWLLLFYALWHRRHVRGKMPAGDVFETLSQG